MGRGNDLKPRVSESEDPFQASVPLALKQDRRFSSNRRQDEPTGEAESLVGKINLKEMGSKVQEQLDQDKQQRLNKRKELLEKKATKPKTKKKEFYSGFGYNNILTATEDLEGINYRPKTKETKSTFELILALVQTQLGDIPQDVLRGATDEVIAICKDDEIKDYDKKLQIEDIINKLESDKFATLLSLTKKLIDYSSDQINISEEKLDDENGVAVVFEEDEDEENEETGFVVDDDDVEYENEIREEVEVEENEQNNEEIDINDQDYILGIGGDKKIQSEKKIEEIQVYQIDAFWIQRSISKYYPDALIAQQKAEECLKILGSSNSIRDCENNLMELFDYENFDLVKLLVKNREIILYCTKLARSKNDQEKALIIREIKESGNEWILNKLNHEKLKDDLKKSKKSKNDLLPMDIDETKPIDLAKRLKTHHDENEEELNNLKVPQKLLDLNELIFEQGSHLMSNKKVKLPEGSFKRTKKGYEEVHVPAPEVKPLEPNERLIPINELPEWAHGAFKNTKSLNRVQSKVYEYAFKNDKNMLLCAPTGAGKTNVAMLTVLREIGKHLVDDDGNIDLENFKIIYIAPMKALVQEMVTNFSSRLEYFGIKVAELTGDRSLTKQQISETQIIVTTPEKWDIITRKSNDRSYTNLVRLIIIDEVHLLHDDRGPVIESIVSRTLRHIEQTQDHVRIVGLSATLPNYGDVATFLRIKADEGVFFFDSSFRPCPLKQQFIGITEKKAIKRFQLMNEIAYEKVLEEAGKNQILIFTHSRKETAKTAKAIRDIALEKETIGQIMNNNNTSRQVLNAEAEETKNTDLQDLLPYGFAIHHAGMTREDRISVEDLFRDGHIQVLVSTATLAWGVNLPAHTVIIKGTQIYNPEKGKWTELSPQDVLQMLGRAGRPQYDTNGEGIIITSHNELQYYLSLLNQQLPIESQFISKLADNLNAEIALGTIRNRNEAVEWLGYTYLYVRMLRNPTLYGISIEEYENDIYLDQKRLDLIHSAAILLDKTNLIKYDKKSGKFQLTELGRISSYYYIVYQSMATYNQHLKPMMSIIDLFRIFSLSEEFKYIPVREEEKLELNKLIERIPIPIKESIEEPSAKINILLQAYISQLKLEGFALMTDMIYITQSAGRILRAIFEICLKRNWAQLSKKCLDLCKMVDKRMWLSMNPLRQFKSIPQDIIKRLERKDFAWERYYDLNPQELGELVGIPKAGKTLHKLIHQFPKIDLQVNVYPITRSMLKIELSLTPDFIFDEKIHLGLMETFWILIEDVDGEILLYHDLLNIKSKYSTEEHFLTFTVPLYDPLPPNYFISVISDRWLHSETRLPISFKNLILPEKYPPHTELLDMELLPINVLKNKNLEGLFLNDNIKLFNSIQTQTFNTLYNTDENVFIGAPSGSGKTICAEFSILRLWKNNETGRIIYILPYEELIDIKYNYFKIKYEKLGKNIVKLTGESSNDLKLLEMGDLIFSLPNHWDLLSRRWKSRPNIQSIGLFIVDEIHLISSNSIGPTLEIITSRMRFISVQTENPIRIVTLGTSLANGKDLGEWIGATVFNFHPSIRPIPLEIRIQGFNIPHFPSLMLAMIKPVFLTIQNEESSIIFVTNRKLCKLLALELINLKNFNNNNNSDKLFENINDETLKEFLKFGIGYYHENLKLSDKKLIKKLFLNGFIKVLISNKDSVWSLDDIKSNCVVVMGAQSYLGKEHRYVDYSISDILKMMGRAIKMNSKFILMCQNQKKDFYKRFLYDSLPIESYLDHSLHDVFNAEIVSKIIENKQEAVDYLTWTFLYRRMNLNPNYYNLSGSSHQHISDHLSELVEITLNDLSNSKCILIEDEMDLSPLNLGMIAAFYYVHYNTIEMFSMSLTEHTKIKGLLEINTSSVEYEDLEIRKGEEKILLNILDKLPQKLLYKSTDPHIKTNILLQTHFSRIQLNSDLQNDLKFILKKILNLIQATVDVISTNGWLNPVITAMELSQMVVQGIWDRDSPLKQIPHFNNELIEKCKNNEIETVFDLIEMEDEDRLNLLNNMTEKQISDVAKFVNAYPNIEINYECEECISGSMSTLKIGLEREDEKELVFAPYFGFKEENWWIIIAHEKEILTIKKTSLEQKIFLKCKFRVPELIGLVKLKLLVICDSYAGCDQEYEFEVMISENMEESD